MGSIAGLKKLQIEHFEEQVKSYRKSLQNAVCYCWHMQQRGLKAPDTLHIKKLLRETSRYFQMDEAALVHAYQRLRDASDEINPTLLRQTG